MGKKSKSNKKMSGFDATMMACGDIIGAGIFSMTGVAIAVAGPGVPITFLLAGVCAMILNLPLMALSSACPVKGGEYQYVSRFTKPWIGFLSAWNFLLGTLSISVLGLSAGQYLPEIFPSLDPTLAGVICIVLITVMCIFNIKTSARIQNAMVILIIITLGGFILLGLPKVTDFSISGMVAPCGIAAIFVAVSYVRTSVYGATVLLKLGDEIENPKKNIPRAMAAATIGCSILYAMVGFVASHAVPWKEMADQPLSFAAKTFMPTAIFSFFVIGGALFGILTSIVGMYVGYSRVLWAGADDGLYPKFFKATNKYGVPHRIILAMMVISLIPVVLKIKLSYLFAATTAPSLLLGLLPIITSLIARKRLPNRFNKAFFRLSKPVNIALVVVHLCITLFLSTNLFKRLTIPTVIGIAIFYGGGLIYFFLRCKYLKEKKNYDLPAAMSKMDPGWLTDDFPSEDTPVIEEQN